MEGESEECRANEKKAAEGTVARPTISDFFHSMYPCADFKGASGACDEYHSLIPGSGGAI